MATSSVTKKHVVTALDIVVSKQSQWVKPTGGLYHTARIRELIPAAVSNPVHALAIGFFAYLRLSDLWFSRTGFIWLEHEFHEHGRHAGFYVADLQHYYCRCLTESPELLIP